MCDSEKWDSTFVESEYFFVEKYWFRAICEICETGDFMRFAKIGGRIAFYAILVTLVG